MTLFTKTQHEQLLANCQAQIVRMDNAQPDIDFKPVVKLFTPDAQRTWLLTELGLDDIAFGLRQDLERLRRRSACAGAHRRVGGSSLSTFYFRLDTLNSSFFHHSGSPSLHWKTSRSTSEAFVAR
jgi:Protein of unknown function (DUF2958)